jgi:hypothetical protein
MPLLFVNCEARNVALGWLHDKNIQLHECSIGGGPKAAANPSLIPRYDPEFDVIYLGQSVLDNFCKEPYDLLNELDPTKDPAWALKWGKLVTMCNTRFTYFAVSEELFLTNAPGLAKIIETFSWPLVLYVIVNVPAGQETDPEQANCS